MYLQLNMVKYNADQEIMNIYENLKTVWSHFSLICYYSLIFGLLQISIGLSVFGFVANEYKWITIHSLLTICNIWSGIWWEITKVILNYLPLPTLDTGLSGLGFLSSRSGVRKLLKNSWIIKFCTFFNNGSKCSEKYYWPNPILSSVMH